jgi:hypothetical protein
MRRSKNDPGRAAGIQRFLPAGDTEAPMISRFQTRKAEVRGGRRKIVARGLGKLEKLGAHPDADGVQAVIARSGVAAAISKESSERIKAARLQRLAEDVGGLGHRIGRKVQLESAASQCGNGEGSCKLPRKSTLLIFRRGQDSPSASCLS